jgi:hypothetical protein
LELFQILVRESEMVGDILEYWKCWRFFSASSRGEHTLFILETRKTIINIHYKSVEVVAGPSATTSTSTSPKKKMNPARARRLKARLELFIKKRVEE